MSEINKPAASTSNNSIISAEIIFKSGELAIREFAAQFGKPVQYLPPHFTLLYGCDGLTPKMKDFLAQFEDPDHAVYTQAPTPVGFDIFPVPAKGYNCVAVKYEWPAGKAVNAAASSDADIFPKGPTFGFNGDKFAAHVTIAYLSTETELTKEMLVEKQPNMSFFDVSIDKITLEISVKRRRKE